MNPNPEFNPESTRRRFDRALCWAAIAIGISLFSVLPPAHAVEYDPLQIDSAFQPESFDLTLKDDDRNREIPIRVFLPTQKTAAPVVLFSHGLGGSRENNPYLGRHWSARGYVVVFMQHAGSDAAVWKNTRPLNRLRVLKEAANLQNTFDRYRDVREVIDQLERLNTKPDSRLKNRMDLDHLGMSGHSYGAVTTQGVSGQTSPFIGGRYTEKRIKAAIAMSPSVPNAARDAETFFGKVSIPWLLMTGTKDKSIIGRADMKSRLGVYPALPPGDKYQLVLDGGEHHAFSDRDTQKGLTKRNPNHHRVILAVSSAFWDAYLQDNQAAKNWLTSDSARSVMESNDRWDHK